MADLDEDALLTSAPTADEIDLSEETQDFRFLSAFGTNEVKIPKRGEKDFEQHGTNLQSDTLAASRQAMHNALSFQRVHQPKGYTMATYHPESNMAYSYNPKGPLFARMGQVLSALEDPLGNDERRGQRLWLLPEELIYLLERGTIDVRWPVSEDDEDDRALPMSVQAAYAMCIGGTLTLERHIVYSSLKRAGYIVLRSADFNGSGPSPGTECYPPLPDRTWRGLHHGRDGCLLQPALYRSYADIYSRLALVQFHDPTTQRPQPSNLPVTIPTDLHQPLSSISVTYNIWKPGTTMFKKSSPGTPDFRIAVVNARETKVPSLQQLSSLMEAVPYEPPKQDAQLYQKLKHGYKNVILAIVDQGVVSYLRLADAAFGRERLYGSKSPRPGFKHGGSRKRGQKRR
ncbi:hypothetical protein BAUCODRAFT_78972 [Baudoinia panamericana UAMH 10762]|uniref:tRNA-splicing endonuclease subunit Sen54 N-terminal domain-containing protein n=1 Tax=Baudoinia panamericana (strain UAMH 10762) TaxID=717646 RepID=M2MY12_BAUPA|nr:uncharacterized protein BAUCODRAFT_78972 [Baudoinia panamericana UAMH 10762]EMC91529.1 hypothetical protein BAUCODRAFT_78972 [Baudoinia panamericana UAMH 10762]